MILSLQDYLVVDHELLSLDLVGFIALSACFIFFLLVLFQDVPLKVHDAISVQKQFEILLRLGQSGLQLHLVLGQDQAYHFATEELLPLDHSPLFATGLVGEITHLEHPGFLVPLGLDIDELVLF